MKNKDTEYLENITSYCRSINGIISHFGSSLEIFTENTIYQYSICFALEHIGELAKLFSVEFVNQNKDRIPFKYIVDLRNRIANDYGSVDFEIIWEIITNDIPELEAFCKEKLKELQALEVNNKTSSAKTTTEPTPDPEPTPTPRFKP